MKTIVLDDDPTGTQSASGVTVLLVSDADLLTEALRSADSVYVQTNSRALDESAAVALARRVRSDGEEAARRLGEDVRFVLRGDSTLRGHVFAETEVFLDEGAVMLFVPAFPAGGRTTLDGVHRVRVGDRDVPAHETEYADDPVFGFSTAVLEDYVRDASGRSAVPVPLDVVRGDAAALEAVLADATAGSVLVPDAVEDDDVRRIAHAVEAVTAAGREVVVRSAAPLAAELAHVASHGLLAVPLDVEDGPVLLVCGSHTAGATAQLAQVALDFGPVEFIRTADALEDPVAAGHTVAAAVASRLDAGGRVAVVSSERVRSADHDTLDHGERVMTALTTAVAELAPRTSVVVAKGGITSAEVASTGIGASSAVVLGQVLPGVSVWRMTGRDGRGVLYVVVPGNVGGPDTLVRVLSAVGVESAATRRA